ncbi:MAG TPA: hypothetical protein VGS22_05865 [Thermoanaerobaculia bacterium]|jgi:hypothetical protein|nr:hypothetical protein [Thermoanaerobaculia bacterium]
MAAKLGGAEDSESADVLSEVRPGPAAMRLARFFAAFAMTALVVAALCGFGWWRAARGRTDLESLSAAAREKLFDEALHDNPGAFVPAWYAPGIGYTLRLRQRISAWDDTFTANALGYRTGPPPKPSGTFRVVFVGDSWTFGMGIKEQESFPRQFQALAKELGASPGHPVEAWTLALPGYNTLNEIAALEYFYPRLAPDAVVLAPCSNDMDTSGVVLPNGSLARSQAERDEFGDDHSRVYRNHQMASFTFLSRWQTCFRAIRAEEQRLGARKVPFLLFFTAIWEEPFVHRLIGESGVRAPYVVTPKFFTTGRWRNPPPYRHGTPEANRIYARMVYRGMADTLGWPAAPAAGDESDVQVHRQVPPGDWVAESDRLLMAETAKTIPEEYEPGAGRDDQCVGPMDCATGLVGRATTVLVRRRAGASRLIVVLRRLPEVSFLYPLAVELSVPSPSGGTRSAVVLPADGAETQSFPLDLPADLPVGAALDVVVRTAGVGIAPDGFSGRSLRIVRIDQE